MDRVVIAHTPLGSELLFKKLLGNEQLSDCYQLNVDMLSTSNAISLQDLLGQQLTLELRPNPFTQRFLSGIITCMEFVGHEVHREDYYLYRATVRPHLWNLTQTRGFRIWQNKTAEEILVEVFQDYNVVIDNQLEGEFRSWEYCVQYQESMYDFVKRLMEHEGIYFYFSHAMGQETLVLCNNPKSHKPFDNYDTIEFHQTGAGGYVNTEAINSWQASASVSASLHSHDDYNYLQSNADLSATKQVSQSGAPDTNKFIEWPGRYPIQGDGSHYAQIRQQEHSAGQKQITGVGDAFGLAPGYTFTLCMAPRAEDEGQSFLITAVDYHLEENSYASNDQDHTIHRFSFSVVPATVTWRPARVTPWPRTSGPQTAMVIKADDATKGDGEHISTDTYGRVRVKFLWFKAVDETQLHSCWLRVSSAWAGSQYGAYQIPRVGEEVVVDFINGDPHTPVIVGRVYNDLQTQPVSESSITESSTSEISDGDQVVAESASEWSYAKSGFWTRTIGSQDVNDGNFLSFDDTEGEQSVDLHSAKKMNISAKGAVKIFSEQTGEDAIKVWSPGQVYIQSADTLSTSAPTQKQAVRGTFYTVTGANFTTNGIVLTINGVNGAITATEFSAKGFVMEYGQIKHTRNHSEFKKNNTEIKSVNYQLIFASLISILNGGGGGVGGQADGALQNQLQKLKDKMSLGKKSRTPAREEGTPLEEIPPMPTRPAPAPPSTASARSSTDSFSTARESVASTSSSGSGSSGGAA